MAGWGEQKEKHGMALMGLCFRIFPHWLLCLIAVPVSFVYYLSSPSARKAVKRYLSRIPGHKHVYGCFYGFALTLIEKLEGWAGSLHYQNLRFGDDDLEELRSRLHAKKGAIFFASHLGNVELMRALASAGETGLNEKIEILSLVYFKGTARFNDMLKKLNPKSMIHLIDASTIGPDAIGRMQEVLDGGGIVVVAGDRTSLSNPGRSLDIPFLGKEAPFPFGVFYLATLLDAPSYTVLFCRSGDLSWRREFDMRVWKNPDIDRSSRKGRMKGARTLAETYARRLEEGCLEHPCQWGNFYDFWKEEAT